MNLFNFHSHFFSLLHRYLSLPHPDAHLTLHPSDPRVLQTSFLSGVSVAQARTITIYSRSIRQAISLSLSAAFSFALALPPLPLSHSLLVAPTPATFTSSEKGAARKSEKTIRFLWHTLLRSNWPDGPKGASVTAKARRQWLQAENRL